MFEHDNGVLVCKEHRTPAQKNEHGFWCRKCVDRNIVDLLRAAEQIIDDFDNWGEVLQTDVLGDYSPNTSIELLRSAVKEIRG